MDELNIINQLTDTLEGAIHEALKEHIEANTIFISPNLAEAINIPPVVIAGQLFTFPSMIMGLNIVPVKTNKLPLGADFCISHSDSVSSTEYERLKEENEVLKEQIRQLREILTGGYTE
jgi:hypothetical protein